MNLVQLKMLDAIVRTQSLSKAASELHKSQPALTLAIKKLETEIGFALLDRNQYRLALTEKGRLFHREAQLLLNAQSHLTQLANELALGNEANFKICYEQLCHAPKYNDIICDAFTQYQSTEFSVSSGKRFAALEQVNKAQADLGIGPWFDLFHATGDLESMPIGKLDIGLVCANNLMPKQLNYQQLQHYSCLAMFESEMSFDSERLSYAKGSAIMKIDDIATLKSFLVSGAGWAMISLAHCQTEIDSGLLQRVEILDREHTFSAQIRVFRQYSVHHGPVARAIWQGFKQASEQFLNE
ncbi:MAG TPA: LysR family transcriptional regulator [Pseudoalteromonas prydzensis]|uniref:LysR family transcriptional regulator n=1 Tax=Pseudoalteromonas prydzensis TaxID=182141 RepID=A0A7V1D130_9GAMM|nr:LysR family transcriptional regulator [Pseudoalteromonas prydzensis]HEA17952.1 LysR family transcriptional regulator [Pseudoalteromonas prydzensis]